MPKVKRERIDCHDLNSARGANLLKEIIRSFWLDRGFTVHVEAYSLEHSLVGKYGVRSNLVNGLPPKHLGLRS